MLNGYGAEIWICPPDGGDPSQAGEAREWRIDGSLVFIRDKPAGIWASHKPVMRAASLDLSGWWFDPYFHSCLDYSFLIVLNAGGPHSHKARGRLSKESILAIERNYLDRALSFPNCALQSAL